MRLSSVVDMAREHLEQAIITGRLKPGQRIKEEEISSFLGISRPPVREAFKSLEAEGLIVRKPRCGVFVAEITANDVWEIYTLKAEMYELAANLAFYKLTGEDINRMGRMVEAMAECVKADPANILAYQELNTMFHDVVIQAARHQRLKRMINSLHNQIRWYSYRTLSDRRHLEQSCRYHQRIFECYRNGDLAGAAGLTREHVLVGLDKLQDVDPSYILPLSGGLAPNPAGERINAL